MAKNLVGNTNVFKELFEGGGYSEIFAENNGTVSVAFGSVAGNPSYAVQQTGGAMSSRDIAKMIKAIELAVKTGNPVITFYNSIGTILAEDLNALTDSANLISTISKASGVIPQIAVVTGVCAASQSIAAASADILIMDSNAEMFMTPPFTSAALGDKSEQAGSSNNAAADGISAITVTGTQDALQAVKKIVGILPGNNLSEAGIFGFNEPSSPLKKGKFKGETTVKSVVDEASAIELYKEFSSEVYTALATVGGVVAGTVATAGEGKTISAKGTVKAARFIRLCDAFSIPVITFVNTDGFEKSTSADISGGIRAAARLSSTYADATTAKICAVTGNAVGMTYTAFCNSDFTLVTETAVISPIEPSAAVTVLWQDKFDKKANISEETTRLAKQYVEEVAGAESAVLNGAADIFVEAKALRANILTAMDMLSTKRVQRLAKKHGNICL